MKLNFSLLRNCAFAVTLLSLPQAAMSSEESADLTLKDVPQEELMAAAGDVLNDTFLESLVSDDSEIASNLVARNHKRRRRKGRSRQKQPVEDMLADAAQSPENNAWTPKFVWLGDIKKDDNLQAFAAFLIGSLNDHEDLQDGHFDPGASLTSNAKNQVMANYNHGYNKDNMTSHKGRNKNNRGQRPPGRARLPKPRVTLDLSGGASFLFFTKYKGDLANVPTGLFPVTGVGARYQVKGGPLHTVTPFYEMDATFNVFKWLGFGAYLQSTQGVAIRTRPYQARAFGADRLVSGDFSADLDLAALGGRVMFNISNLIKFKTWCMGIIAGGGAGVGFQTWKNTQGYVTYSSGVSNLDQTTINMTWGTRYGINLSYTGDAAISFKSRNPYAALTLLKLGCKFVGWGHSKELGKARNPGYYLGYFKPVSFENIFSVVPYIGFEWSF